jgi:2-polyprenyl-3-methyl-5-hydroxy-6-metoxy-1,4-benzoquinol methylase
MPTMVKSEVSISVPRGETNRKKLTGSHARLERRLFSMLGEHAALNYCGPLVRTRYAWAARELAKLEPGKILDAGSGTGLLTLGVSRSSDEVVGVSNVEQANNHGQQRAQWMGASNVRFETADILSEDFRDANRESFDTAVCLEVIEHVEEPSRLLDNLNAVLKPGGRLILSTPYIGHVPQRDEFELNVQPGGHVVWGYDEEDLRSLFEGSNFKIENVGYIGGMGNHVLNNVSRRLTPRAPLAALGLTTALYPGALLVDHYGALRGFPPIAIGIVAKSHTT